MKRRYRMHPKNIHKAILPAYPMTGLPTTKLHRELFKAKNTMYNLVSVLVEYRGIRKSTFLNKLKVLAKEECLD